MKILALSLLRTGDLFMHEAILEEIQSQFPHAELHLLVNDLNAQAVELLKVSCRVHVLNRSYQQKYLVEENRPWKKAQQNLRQLVQALNYEKFDMVYNLTHTFFSARLMDAIQAPQKKGIHFQEGQVVPHENRWGEYLNERFAQKHQTEFHSLPLLAKALTLKTPALRQTHNVQEKSRICLQVLTSDVKKNWSLPNFSLLAELLLKKYPQHQITILGAPNEKEQIEKFFKQNQSIQLHFPKWSELPEILQQARLLITGDTSVQHLAVQAEIPVLSIFLGSANPFKTGPYQEGAIVLQSQVACAPCFHSSACPKPEHLCGNELKVSDVFDVCQAILENKKLPDVQGALYRVRQNLNHQYLLQRINQEAYMENLNHQFEQIIWQIYLDGDYRDLAAPYGTSAHHILEEHFASQQTSILEVWLHKRLDANLSDQMFLEELEQKVMQAAAAQNYDESAFQTAMQDCLALLKNYQRQRSDRADYLFTLQQCLAEKNSLFPLLRKVKTGIVEARTLLSIENKFTQTLITEMKERGHRYVSGTRKLSETCSTQA